MSDLAEHTERIARQLLGEPNSHLSSKAQLRFGSHGSVAVEIKGKKAGTWYDHETETGGGLLDLIVRERGGRRRDAMHWIKSLGIDLASGNGAAGPARRRGAEYVYHERDGEPVYRVVRWGPEKTFTQERWDAAAGKFVGGRGCMADVPRVPYRMHEWIDKPGPIWIAEGEKDADNLARLSVLSTTNAGGAGKWSKDFAAYFAGREVIICGDNDEAGRKHVRQVAANLRPVAKSLRIVEVPPLVGKDVSNWLDAGHALDELLVLDAPSEEPEEEQGTERLERLVERATADPGAAFEESAVDFLAALRARDPAAYERARARLKGAKVRVGVLDQEVDRRKREPGDSAKGKALDLPEPEPWGELVEGAELIADLVAQIQRFVILADHAAAAAALWVLHAHAHDAAFHSPRLTITSPTMRCGKSTLLRVIARLVPRSLATANITSAAMFRVIEACKPCLLIDEADSFANDNEELRGVVNSSHCRLDAFVVRAVPAGDDYEARRFSTWAPMAIASIGRIASTIADRSVIIAMERKSPGVTVSRMRADRDDGFGELARKAARWASDNLEALSSADPDLPRVLNDRQADNWRLLLAAADLIGGHWPGQARAAALALSATDEDAETIGVQLLASVRLAFGTARQISTENLLKHLHAMIEAPWCEYGRARKPISPRQLATLLRQFRIASSTMRDGEVTYKGYRRAQFEDAWARYLFESDTPSQAKESASLGDFSSVTADPDGMDRNSDNARQSATCAAVTDRKLPPEEKSPDLTIEDLDQRCGNGPGTPERCIHCGESVEPGMAGTTATSSGEYLHNRCVARWVSLNG